MKSELEKLIEKWESEKGSYIPNAPIYQAFIDDAKEALKREKQGQELPISNVVGRSEQLFCDMCGSKKLEDCGSDEFSCKNCGHFPITN